jgi:hypothetical protein
MPLEISKEKRKKKKKAKEKRGQRKKGTDLFSATILNHTP